MGDNPPASAQYYGWSSRLGLINHGQCVLTGGPFSPDDRHQRPGAGSADTQVVAERLGRDRSLVGDPMGDVFLPGAFNQVTVGGDWQRSVMIVAGWFVPVVGLGNQNQYRSSGKQGRPRRFERHGKSARMVRG